MCDLSDHQLKTTWMVSVEGEKQKKMSISNFKHLLHQNHVADASTLMAEEKTPQTGPYASFSKAETSGRRRIQQHTGITKSFRIPPHTAEASLWWLKRG